MPYRFRNENGDVIEVEDDTAANDYRNREGFTEVGTDEAQPSQPSQPTGDNE